MQACDKTGPEGSGLATVINMEYCAENEIPVSGIMCKRIRYDFGQSLNRGSGKGFRRNGAYHKKSFFDKRAIENRKILFKEWLSFIKLKFV